jgi:hypothetical protein
MLCVLISSRACLSSRVIVPLSLRADARNFVLQALSDSEGLRLLHQRAVLLSSGYAPGDLLIRQIDAKLATSKFTQA